MKDMNSHSPFANRAAEILHWQDTENRSAAHLERDDLTPTRRTMFEDNIRRARTKIQNLLEAEIRSEQ